MLKWGGGLASGKESMKRGSSGPHVLVPHFSGSAPHTHKHHFDSLHALYFISYQGRLFFYYSPQTLGNNFFPLGKNFKFCKKEKKIEKKL